MNKRNSLSMLLCLSFFAVAFTDTAGACGNGVEYRIDHNVTAVSEAERLLNRNQAKEAASLLQRVFPKLQTFVPGRQRVNDRALRVYAASLVRLNGELQADRRPQATPEQRLRWAAHTLASLQVRSPADAGLQTLLGEAWGSLPETHAKAWPLLTTLEQDDRITSGRGHAVLAKLRLHVDDGQPAWLGAPLLALHHARAQLAVSRCQRVTRNAEYCTAAPVPERG